MILVRRQNLYGRSNTIDLTNWRIEPGHHTTPVWQEIDLTVDSMLNIEITVNTLLPNEPGYRRVACVLLTQNRILLTP